MRELEAAQRWGVTPGEWDALPKDDRIEMLAWYEARWKMDVVNAFEASRPVKRRRR